MPNGCARAANDRCVTQRISVERLGDIGTSDAGVQRQHAQPMMRHDHQAKVLHLA